MSDKWREVAEDELYRRSNGGTSELDSFLEVGRANRIHSDKQAKIWTYCRVAGDQLGGMLAEFLHGLVDYGEDYQLTIGPPINSRTQKLEGVKAIRASQAEKGMIGMFPGIPTK